MSTLIAPGDVERFRAIVAQRLGLAFDDGKLGLLADVLRQRSQQIGISCDAYLRRLASGDARSESTALAPWLTVSETYFFRYFDQFRAFSEVALPARMHARNGHRCLRMLSAGCASGEEAYSLAILTREIVSDPSWDIAILGVDLNPVAIEKATQARFSAWALRETPPEIQRRWFHPEGRDMVLDKAVHAAVRFEERNLAEDDPELWRAASYDVVFCRNMLMYFTPESAQALVARITGALAPEGYLFLGHAETLRGLSHDFHLRHTHDTFYYQRRDCIEAPAQAAFAQSYTPSATPLASVLNADTWVDAIRQASERIHTLTSATPARPSAIPVAPRPSWNLGRALDLLQHERFAEALAVVEAFPPESAGDPDVLLLQAVLLAHSGRLDKAEETCRLVLAIDELNAGAQYVLALCREGAGDRRGAADYDQIASYIDPSFAMPRLHLGLLWRRANDLQSARHELTQALVLLQREDPSRLLLFGGGFSRDALSALCRAELVACGGAP